MRTRTTGTGGCRPSSAATGTPSAGSASRTSAARPPAAPSAGSPSASPAPPSTSIYSRGCRKGAGRRSVADRVPMPLPTSGSTAGRGKRHRHFRAQIGEQYLDTLSNKGNSTNTFVLLKSKMILGQPKNGLTKILF